jgi:hypothetical protein
MAGNHLDTNVIIDDGNGTGAAPGANIGFGVNVADTTVALGPTISSGAGAPTFTAAKGSLYLRSDSAGETYHNTDGAVNWVAI